MVATAERITDPKLGLDGIVGSMQKLVIAFDVDGTLVSEDDVPCMQYIWMLQTLSKLTKNVKIVVWSGGGKQYAEMWGKRLELDEYVWKYMAKDRTFHVDIAVDDQQAFALGDKNIIVRLK